MPSRLLRRVFGPSAASTTAATVYTNTTGQTTKITELIITQPGTGLVKNVILSIGTDATGTRAIIFPVPAGAGTWILNPGIVLTGTEIIQLSASTDTGVANVTANGIVEAA